MPEVASADSPLPFRKLSMLCTPFEQLTNQGRKGYCDIDSKSAYRLNPRRIITLAHTPHHIELLDSYSSFFSNSRRTSV